MLHFIQVNTFFKKSISPTRALFSNVFQASSCSLHSLLSTSRLGLWFSVQGQTESPLIIQFSHLAENHLTCHRVVLLNEETDTDDNHRRLLSVPISWTRWQQLQTRVACSPAACAMKQDYNMTVVQFLLRTISAETYGKRTANLVGLHVMFEAAITGYESIGLWTRQFSRGMASPFEDDPTELEAQIVRGSLRRVFRDWLQTGLQLKIWG